MATVVQFNRIGGPEVLEFVSVGTPKPGPKEVLLQVKAIGLNRAEIMWRTGTYMEQPKFPAKIGFEGSGIVAAVGSQVTGFNAGQRVAVIPSFSNNDYGLYADYALAPLHAVAPLPDNLSFEEGAAIWMAYMTAYDGLIGEGHLKKGDFVAISAASSSVGVASIQLVNMMGGTAIAITRKSAKTQGLKDAGAAHVIITELQSARDEILRITDGRGADITFDPVGGARFAELVEATAARGWSIVYGALDPAPVAVPVHIMLGKQPRITGSYIMTTARDEAKRKEAIVFITRGLESGALKPVISKVFKFEQIVDSHRYLESNEQLGKVVVSV